MTDTTYSRTASVLCCGLDPDASKLPSEFAASNDQSSAILTFLQSAIDSTAAHVCAYKLQKAFFDILPHSKDLLIEVISYIRHRHPEALIIIDAKVGDIDNTMAAYYELFFNQLGADAIVTNPLMGEDVWSRLNDFAGKSAFVLVRTSNPSSEFTQDVRLSDGRTYWRFLLDLVLSEFAKGRLLWPILSSTHPIDRQTIQDIAASRIPLLIAGIGAQGGSYDTLAQFAKVPGRLYVNSSRALLYPYDRNETNWRGAIASAAEQLCMRLNGALGRA